MPLEVLYSLLYGVLLLGGSMHVLLHKRDPRSAALWLLLLLTLPVGGLVLYLLFGVDRVARRALLKEVANQQIRQALHAAQPGVGLRSTQPGPPPRREEPRIPQPPPRFEPVLSRLCALPLLSGNRIRWMSQGDHVYARMLSAIENARHHVHLETYIFQPDRVGRQLVELMIEKAAQGVEVRVLYDTIGSTDALWFMEEVARTRVKVAEFSPLNPFKRGWQVNLRNHRKLLVVDGQLAFTGGMNINEKHLIDHPLLTRVRDYHFQVEGPVVRQMQEWFVEDWYYARGEKLLAPAYFPSLPPQGEVDARVITAGPDGDYEALYRVILAAIAYASERVYLVTPYFIPDQGLLTTLQLAAARGVEITLVLPGHSDHPFVSWASRAYYEPLLRAGIRIYERGAPFLHAKVMVVDDAWALVGSSNMDIRSFRLNFEANLELRSPSFIETLLRAIAEEIEASTRVEASLFLHRPTWRVLGERTCALLSPLL